MREMAAVPKIIRASSSTLEFRFSDTTFWTMTSVWALSFWR